MPPKSTPLTAQMIQLRSQRPVMKLTARNTAVVTHH